MPKPPPPPPPPPPVPTITSFSPTHGLVGASVQISGTNFTGATSVKFNATTATFTVTSATVIQTTVPSGATTGPVHVTTPAGTANSTSNFTVEAPPMPVVSRVQQVIASTDVEQATLEATLPNPVTPGNTLIVGVAHFTTGPTEWGPPAVGSVVDNQSFVYTRDAIGIAPTVFKGRGAIFSRVGIGSGNITVTYTLPVIGSAVPCALVVSEYAGLALDSAVDVTGAGGSDTDSTTPDSGITQPTDKVGGLAVAMIAMSPPDSWNGPASPFETVVVISESASLVSTMADALVTTAGPYQCVWTCGFVFWDACIVVYRPRPYEGYSMGEGSVASRYPQDLET